MPFMEVNRCRFRYDLMGEGPDLVFIHGEHHGTAYFEFQLPHFSRRYRCLAYDRRAHGHTEAPAYGYSLHNQTVDLAGLLKGLKIERPLVIAIAFGAVIALNLELECPGSIRALVMVGWSEIDGSPGYIEHFERQMPEVEPILRERGEEALVSHILTEGERLVPVLPGDPRLREAYARMFASRPLEAFEKRLELATSVPDLTQGLHGVAIPILALEGECDPFPARVGLLDGHANIRQETFPNAGRFVQWEQPEGFNRLVDDFFGSLSDAA